MIDIELKWITNLALLAGLVITSIYCCIEVISIHMVKNQLLPLFLFSSCFFSFLGATWLAITSRIPRLNCLIGYHRWDYQPFSAVVMRERMKGEEDSSTIGERRCVVCEKVQYLEKHCLGLQPPEYYFYWRNQS